MVRLRPRHIFYSQDSINCVFDARSNHPFQKIGKTLDRLCEDRCDIEDIPPIEVMRDENTWITDDNRRLRVFRHLERLGKCSKIDVIEVDRILARKLTSTNGGTSVRVRGDSPGGRWYLKEGVNAKFRRKAKRFIQHYYEEEMEDNSSTDSDSSDRSSSSSTISNDDDVKIMIVFTDKHRTKNTKFNEDDDNNMLLCYTAYPITEKAKEKIARKRKCYGIRYKGWQMLIRRRYTNK